MGRFYKMVIESGFERLSPVGGCTQPGYRHQKRARDDAHTPNFPCRRVTIHAGHLDIKYHHLMWRGVIRCDRADTVRNRLDGAAVCLKE
ncbi:hypothetical protein bAD24_I01665 [Burkholderia sp. AD24]|nr:hypothetical protein bAD24_I01665 [Burkholderia sp. AD24]